MREQTHTLTPEGMSRLKAELDYLRTNRYPDVLGRLQQSRVNEPGDMEDNTEFQETMREFQMLLGRIQEIENIIAHAIVISPDQAPSSMVQVGSKVRVRNEEGKEQVYQIVDTAEARLVDREIANGFVSRDSPVGRSLMGKIPGDEVEVRVPSGIVKLTILDVK